MRRITQFVHVIRLFCMVGGIFALLPVPYCYIDVA